MDRVGFSCPNAVPSDVQHAPRHPSQAQDDHIQDLQMVEARRDLKRTLDICSGIKHLCEGY